MELKLAGKHVLVTGGSRGIGKAIAELFHDEGCQVTIAGRRKEALEETAGAIQKKGHSQVKAVSVDLSTVDGIKRLVSDAGPVDVLVNNAGGIPPGNLLQLSHEDWRKGWDLKVFGYISLCREIYPLMAERKSGVIVNVIGTKSEKVDPEFIAATAGNAALTAFTKALGEVSPRDGIRVVGVSPGPVETEFFVRARKFKAQQQFGDPEKYQDYYSEMPFQRPASPLEIAAAVVFLASPMSGYTSGAILTLDGGDK